MAEVKLPDFIDDIGTTKKSREHICHLWLWVTEGEACMFLLLLYTVLGFIIAQLTTSVGTDVRHRVGAQQMFSKWKKIDIEMAFTCEQILKLKRNNSSLSWDIEGNKHKLREELLIKNFSFHISCPPNERVIQPVAVSCFIVREEP